jgi:hypothetical protein
MVTLNVVGEVLAVLIWLKRGFSAMFGEQGFEVLTAVFMKIPILWNITLRNVLKVNRGFGGTSYFCLQDRRVSQARNQQQGYH